MNPNDSALPERLRHELANRLDRVSASGDLTAPAIDRAHTIRRRRHTVTAAAAALGTVVVAAPFVWWSVRGPQPVVTPATTTTVSESATSTQLPPTTSTPAPTSPSSTPTTRPTAAGVPTGDADAPRIRVTVDPEAPLVAQPELPYILDKTLYRGGTTTTFDVERSFQYFPLARGRSLVIERGPAGYDLATIHDPDGKLLAEVPATRGQYLVGAVNDAGNLFVLLDSSMQGSDPTATLSVFDEAGAPLYEKRNVLANVTIAGFVGRRVFLGNYTAGRSSVWDLEADSISLYTDEAIVAAVNEKTGRAAFYPRSEFAEARCTTVSDVTGPSPRPVSVTCGMFQPTTFSPDGRYLLGIEVPSDGMLQSPSRVIDVETGRSVIEFDETNPFDIGSGFLADGSVALNLVLDPDADGARNTLLRCTLEGSCSRMVETVSMPDFGTTMAARYAIVPK